MHDLRGYGEAIAREIVPPDLEALEQVALSRRRTRRGALGGAAVAAVVAAVMVLPGWRETATPPTETPGTHTSTPSRDWRAAEIVGHPQARLVLSIDASDPVHRLPSVSEADSDGQVLLWFRCRQPAVTEQVSDCVPGNQAFAIEVTGSRGEPLEVRLTEASFLEDTLRYVGDGRFFLSGKHLGTPDVLVGAGMREPLPLSTTSGTVPARPGLGIVQCNALPPCVLDAQQGTLTRVVTPGIADVTWVNWSATTETGLWGIASTGDEPAWVVSHDQDGVFQKRLVGVKLPSDDLILAQNATSTTMAVYLRSPRESLDRLAVSTEQGRTWRTLRTPNAYAIALRSPGFTRAPLLPADWRSWPEVTN